MGVTADLRGALRRAFPRRLVAAGWDRERYAHDAGLHWEEPLAVATPTDESETRALVRWCAEHDLPITSRGAGSSIAGNAFGAGLVVDFSVRMNRILAYDRRTGRVRVQPGVVLDRLNRFLAPFGRRIGPSPSSSAFCTVGGMIGNNAAGSHSLLYGATAENLAGVRFLTADGAPNAWSRRRRAGGRLLAGLADLVHEYRRRPRAWDRLAKNSSGYLLGRTGEPPAFNPHRILCGSEGTLGVITEAVLATHPVPPFVGTVAVGFAASEAALEAVPRLLRERPAAVELVDEAAVRALLRHHPGLPRVVRSSPSCLVVDFFGRSARSIREAMDRVQRRIAGATGFLRVEAARDPRSRDRLWAARRAVEPLLRRLGGRRRPVPFIEDVVVPVERQAAYLRAFRRLLSDEGLEAPLYGHAGQGNLHVRPLINLRDPRERARLLRVNERVARLARRLGGSLSGEHGDGYLRSSYLRRLFPQEYALFRRVKDLFDPRELLNPGKIVEARRRVSPRLFIEGPRYEPPPWV